MKLRCEELKRLADDAGLTVEQLADSLAGQGLKGPKAVSAVRNWIAGRDHPRCKRAHIVAMATAIGCEPREIVRFTSEVRSHRGSAKKAQK